MQWRFLGIDVPIGYCTFSVTVLCAPSLNAKMMSMLDI